MNMKQRLILGTRKGVMVLDRESNGWRLSQHGQSGIPVPFAFCDARNATMWASLDHGHWGPKLARSKDAGKTWEDVPAPKYPEGALVKEGKPAALEYIWYIAPGPARRPNRMYLGTNPGGLFQSDDGGNTFALVEALWNQPSRMTGWFGGGRDTPGIHSLFTDPRNPDRTLIAISCAGVFETLDDGKSWTHRNKGLRADFLPDPSSEIGQDPHFMMACAANPDVLWQQNHCGIFRSEDGAKNWTDISESAGPARFGFAVAAHAKDPKTAWVVPGKSDQERTTIDGALFVCRTQDGGKTWQKQTKGLPQQLAYDLVYRHALDIAGDALAFGSTTGNLFFSPDGGENWTTVANYLPPIYSVRFAEF